MMRKGRRRRPGRAPRRSLSGGGAPPRRLFALAPATPKTPDYRSLNYSLASQPQSYSLGNEALYAYPTAPQYSYFTGYSGVLTSPFFGQPTDVRNPRKVQLGLRLSF